MLPGLHYFWFLSLTFCKRRLGQLQDLANALGFRVRHVGRGREFPCLNFQCRHCFSLLFRADGNLFALLEVLPGNLLLVARDFGFFGNCQRDFRVAFVPWSWTDDDDFPVIAIDPGQSSRYYIRVRRRASGGLFLQTSNSDSRRRAPCPGEVHRKAGPVLRVADRPACPFRVR